MKMTLRRTAEPLYVQIRAHLLEKITGDRNYPIPSENHLCTLFGVSRPTVRKALEYFVENNLIVRKQGKGTFVQNNRPIMSPARERTVAVVLPEGWHLTDSEQYLARIMEGIISASKGSPVDLKVVNYSPYRFLSRLCQAGTRFSLWISPNEREIHLMEKLLEKGLLPVALNRRVNHSGISYVSCNHVHGGYLAAEHLLSRGHRHIGFVGSTPELAYLAERYRGFVAAHRTHGVPPDNATAVYPRYNDDSVKAEMRALMRKHDRPTALFVGDGALQKPVLDTLEELRVWIPEDISLISFDDMAGVSREHNITVLDQPVREIGRLGMERIANIRQGNGKRFTVLLEPLLIQRDSVRTLQHDRQLRRLS